MNGLYPTPSSPLPPPPKQPAAQQSAQAVELPHDEYAESYVAGSLVVDPKAYALVGRLLSEDCFYDPIKREVFKAVDSLGKEGREPDFAMVNARLQQMKSQATALDLMNITGNVASAAHIEAHAARLRELSIRRRLWQVGQTLSLAAISQDMDVQQAQQKTVDGMAEAFGSTLADQTLGGSLEALRNEMEENQKRGGRILGTQTGFSRIDQRGGLHKGDLVIVAGESSQGKTSFALSIVRNAIFRGARIAFYSMEMTSMQLTARLVSPLAGVSSSRILYGTDLQVWERQSVDTAMRRLPGDRLYFDDDSLSSLDDILVSIRMMKARYGIQGAVVDYLQILGNNARNSRMTREQTLGDAARRLKNIAKELDIWVIALSQLSRSKESHEPTLDRIRDSGQIVEAADTVMLIYRPEAVEGHPQFEKDRTMDIHGKALVKVAKGRNTGTYDFFCDFDSKTATFSDPEAQGMEEPEEQALPF